ncbi:hypothetical protein QUW41_10205 [Slackia piriformis]|nr:hypothetical protein [Slackia piriformis]
MKESDSSYCKGGQEAATVTTREGLGLAHGSGVSDAEVFCALVESSNELSIVALAMESANVRLDAVLSNKDEEEAFLANFYFGVAGVVSRVQERLARAALM